MSNDRFYNKYKKSKKKVMGDIYTLVTTIGG